MHRDFVLSDAFTESEKNKIKKYFYRLNIYLNNK